MRPHGTALELERRRLRAAELFHQGYSPAEVAEQLDTTPQTARRWRSLWQTGGSPALKAKPTPGRPCKLSELQKRGLRQRLLKGACSQGFATDLWTGKRVKALIQRCYGVSYHECHLDRMLHQMGFSPSEACQRVG